MHVCVCLLMYYTGDVLWIVDMLFYRSPRTLMYILDTLEEKGKVVSLLLSRSSVVLLGSNSFNSGYIFIIEML